MVEAVSNSSEIEVDQVSIRSPTYKAEITVDQGTAGSWSLSVDTSQRVASPKMRETEGWTKEQYQSSNLKLSRQPVAANGTELGIVALVKLKVTETRLYRFHVLF